MLHRPLSANIPSGVVGPTQVLYVPLGESVNFGQSWQVGGTQDYTMIATYWRDAATSNMGIWGNYTGVSGSVMIRGQSPELDQCVILPSGGLLGNQIMTSVGNDWNRTGWTYEAGSGEMREFTTAWPIRSHFGAGELASPGVDLKFGRQGSPGGSQNDVQAWYSQCAIWRATLTDAQINEIRAGADLMNYSPDHYWDFNGNANDAVGGITGVLSAGCFYTADPGA